MSKSKGVLLLYSESKQLDYKRLAKLSARLAENYLNVPSTVIKIDDIHENTRTFRYEEGVETIEWNNIGRHNAYNLSPYDETILIDTDYFIQNNNLANYFGSQHDLLCHNTSWDITGNEIFRHNRFLANGGNGFEMHWATVLYFKKSEHAKRVFQVWEKVFQNYDYYGKLLGFRRSPFRNDFALSVAHNICNGYKNTNTFEHNLPAMSTTDSVIDYGNNNWLIKYNLKNTKNIMRYKGDLHVMNKKCILDTDVYDKLWDSI
tara:strand:- start:412 stop:1194 length:783 start_codon:yes stop_codon:yes gene_type:complete